MSTHEGEDRREELTPWFPPQISPVHSGYYDTRRYDVPNKRHIEIRLYWNAKRRAFYASPNSNEFHGHYSFEQWREWRGLAREPK